MLNCNSLHMLSAFFASPPGAETPHSGFDEHLGIEWNRDRAVLLSSLQRLAAAASQPLLLTNY